MGLLIDFLLLLLGLGFLLGGGDVMVRGASGLAAALRISPLIIGLTVVSFGTSAPEVAVNAIAAYEGNGDLSFGNIIGSNFANMGLIIGTAALLRALVIHGVIISRELPMMLLGTLAVSLMAFDPMLRDGAAGTLDRTDGALLLLLFGVFIYYTIGDALRQRYDDAFVQDAEASEYAKQARGGIAWNLFLTVAGILGLVGGGRLTVYAGVDLAEAMGVPEVIIGLTIIAIGTSLPELVTSVTAVLRGQSDIAVGNVVGSNIFNLLFVMGITASVRPVPVPEGGYTDLFVMGAMSVLLLPFAITHRRRIVRTEGLVLLLLYISYTGWRALGGSF